MFRKKVEVSDPKMKGSELVEIPIAEKMVTPQTATRVTQKRLTSGEEGKTSPKNQRVLRAVKKRKNKGDNKLPKKKLCQFGQSSKEGDESILGGVGKDQTRQAL